MMHSAQHSSNETSTACGKFILAGEHSVVYGSPALGIPLTKLRLSLKTTNTSEFSINSAPVSEANQDKLLELLKIFDPKSEIQGIEIHSQIPMGSGLGSSASLCTALARNFHHLDSQSLALKSLEGEKLFHKHPSGIDPFTIAYEKPIFFNSDSLTCEVLNLNTFFDENLCFVLFNSGTPHNTFQVQEHVDKIKTQTPEKFNKIISSLTLLAEQSAEVLTQTPRKHLPSLMTNIHAELCELGVSHPFIEKQISTMTSLPGFLGAKLTGAGCGGFVIGLFEKSSIEKIPSYADWHHSGFVFDNKSFCYSH